MTLKNDGAYQETDEQQFLELSNWRSNVGETPHRTVTRSGYGGYNRNTGRLLQIVPDKDKLAMTGISVEDIENTLSRQ